MDRNVADFGEQNWNKQILVTILDSHKIAK